MFFKDTRMLVKWDMLHLDGLGHRLQSHQKTSTIWRWIRRSCGLLPSKHTTAKSTTKISTQYVWFLAKEDQHYASSIRFPPVNAIYIDMQYQHLPRSFPLGKSAIDGDMTEFCPSCKVSTTTYLHLETFANTSRSHLITGVQLWTTSRFINCSTKRQDVYICYILKLLYWYIDPPEVVKSNAAPANVTTPHGTDDSYQFIQLLFSYHIKSLQPPPWTATDNNEHRMSTQ